MKKTNILFTFFVAVLLLTRFYGLAMEDGERFIRVIGWISFGLQSVGYWQIFKFRQAFRRFLEMGKQGKNGLCLFWWEWDLLC
jgi:hypothetical protein